MRKTNNLSSWMTYFFRRKFSLPEGELGTIFFFTSTIAAASMLVASSIAKRIGNIKASNSVFNHSLICSFEANKLLDHGLHSSPLCHLLVADLHSQ